MRREGFELSVSPPRVVYRLEDGQRLEPLEEVICEVEDEHSGSVIEVCCVVPRPEICLIWGASLGTCCNPSWTCGRSMVRRYDEAV